MDLKDRKMKGRILLLIATLSGAAIMTVSTAQAAPGKGRANIYKKGWIDFNKNGVKDVYEDPAAPLENRVEDLLKQMTVEEKTCQMVTLYGYKRVLQDELPTEEWKNLLWKDGIGAIDEHLNGFRGWGTKPYDSEYTWPASKHAQAINTVQRWFVEETRLGIPVDFTNEGIRGVENLKATAFPTQLGLGHTWDRELIREIGRITGREARLLGYTNVYAPILDVGRDQRWGRYEEIYGEDPFLVAELGTEMVLGLQQDFQVASTGKHFIAYSNNKGAREGMARVDPQTGPHEIENIHVYPWKEVIARSGMLGAMCSYNDIDGSPVEGSKYWLTERLRKDFGFRGYVVSDSDAVEYLHSKHRTSPSMKESVRQSVEAGLNVRCTFRSPDSYVLPLRELVNEGTISMETIDERVRDILRVKFIVGLFDHPYQEDTEAADREVNSEENNAVSLRASREALVLLKNAGGTLPLNADKLKKVAVIGPNADNTDFAKAHYGPLDVDCVSVYEGLKKALEGKAEVAYAQGCDLVDSNWPLSEIMYTEPDAEVLGRIDDAVRLASESDVVVAVVGGGLRTCGENKSRTSLDLPGHQELLLRQLKKAGKPMIVVLINGRPLSVNWAAANADAILEAWYPGPHGGTAIAEVLLGEYNPGGKLTVTFPKTVGQIPFNFPYKPYSQVDGAKVPGIKGNQTRINGPLYSFGHGLSYTSFKYSDLSMSSEEIPQDGNVDLTFKVTNTGRMTGDEVVQLYFRDMISSITVYEQQLRGFERITLEPGESREITFRIKAEDLSLLDKDFNRVVEPGAFEMLIASSSTDIRLRDTLYVVAPDGSGRESDKGHASKYPATLERGQYVTESLGEGYLIDNIGIVWDNDSLGARFEVQISDGGGQFLTVCRDVTSAGQTRTYKFRPVKASEVKVVVTGGAATIRKIILPEKK